MVKSQRKELTDPRLNPDKAPGKRGEFTEECGEWREEADYLLEHRPRGNGGAAKVSMAARYQDYENLLTRKKHQSDSTVKTK